MARILVVDDEADIRVVLCARLEAAGYETEVAGTGLEALSRVRDRLPDLVVLDLMLPGMDGFSLCAMLKRDQRFARIPILILSARCQSSDRQCTAALGADAYLAKPFRPEELLGLVSRLLARGGSAPGTTDNRAPENRPSPKDDERIPAPEAAS